jgi:ATP-dependent RNA helicase DDX35
MNSYNMADFDIAATFIPSLHKPASLLPIARHRQNLLYLIETYPVTIVVGQTGSGKTTQIPQYLEQAGWCSDGKVIAVTQVCKSALVTRLANVSKPRRVAATTVAVRVAEEMGCEVGKEVGYSIRFEDVTSAATRIKFLTDGLLLREALVDPLLSRYSVIMVDEAHERSLSTDVLLGVLKKIIKRRPELRIVISSATLQAEDFLKFFMGDSDAPLKPAAASAVTLDDLIAQGSSTSQDTAFGGNVGRIISLEGRMYPVDVLYLENPAEDYVEKAVQTVFDIHTKEPDGDILVFLTGREEIDTAVQAISERAANLHPRAQSLMPLPLYAGLSTEQQMYVFEEAPENTRKVIFSTNIAEASVTIDGIVYVVDTGFVKLRAYNPSTGIETLTATPISKASATQRAGRAGRTKPGKCYRLYTEGSFQSMEEATVPEIQRSNLAPVILQLKALGIDNIVRFDFITSPPAELVIRALELLYSLGALDDYAKLTRPLGIRMAELAVEPMMAKTLLSAPSFGCLSEILTIAAMTSLGGNIWFHDDEKKKMETARRKFAVEEGDHITLLNVYQAFVTQGKKEARFCHDNYINFKAMTRAVSIRAQLKRYLERFGMNVGESLSSNANKQPLSVGGPDKGEQIRRCLTTGFFAHAAKMQPDGTFRNVAGGTILHAHPSSLMFNRKADWVIFHEVMETGNKTFIRDVTKIEKNWLVEYAPDFYKIR